MTSSDAIPAAPVRWIPVGEQAVVGDSAVVPDLLDSERAGVAAVIAASIAGNTAAAYASDWRRFTDWCTSRGFVALPAHELTVAAYLTAAAEQTRPDGRPGFVPATLTRWVSSINQVHTAAGLPAPGKSETVRRTLAGIRATRATPAVRRHPLSPKEIKELVASTRAHQGQGGWGQQVLAVRDIALLLLGYMAALRSDSLAQLQLRDVALHPDDGLHLTLRKSKTDQQAHGRVVAVPVGEHPATCGVCAYLTWRQLLDANVDGGRPTVIQLLRRTTTPGAAPVEHRCRTVDALDPPAFPLSPLFPVTGRTGQIGESPLTAAAIAARVKARAAQAGWPEHRLAQLGGHSLRRGRVTAGFRAGESAHDLKDLTGHTSMDTLDRYRDAATPPGSRGVRLGL